MMKWELILVLSILFIWQIGARNVPGIGLKVDNTGLADINKLLCPLIMSRYTNKDYKNLNIKVSGTNYELKLDSLTKFILDPLSSTMEAVVAKKTDPGFRVTFKNVQGYATFSSEIKIKGQAYSGVGKVIYDQTTISLFVQFTEKGIRESIEIFVQDIVVDKNKLAVIYSDKNLNQTLNQYKDILNEAYAKATQEFVGHLVILMNEGPFHNLILGYSRSCGFNVTLVDLPDYDLSNSEAILKLDGSVIDINKMTPITTMHPSRFPIEAIKSVRKSRFVFGATTLAGVLGGCKDHILKYHGRTATVKTTTEQIPEIFSKYSKTDTFFADVSLSTPLNIGIHGNEITVTDSVVLFNLKVQKGDHKDTVFTIGVTTNFKSSMNYNKHTASFSVKSPEVHDVKVIFSEVQLDTNKLKSAFQIIAGSFVSEYNAEPPFIDYHADGMFKYFSYYLDVTDMQLLEEYVGIKFDPVAANLNQ